MASYDSNKVNQPGQYPTTDWHWFGLPEQSFGSGAAGGAPPSNETDAGHTNQPGQAPGRESFTGMSGIEDSHAPGTQGIPNEYVGGEAGPQGDAISYSLPTFSKGMTQPGGMEQGHVVVVAHDSISGPSDWTQANDFGYQAPAQYQMPGVAGNTPAPGDGRFQTDGEDGSGHVLYGGFLNGQRPGTSRHPNFSGPGS